MSSAMPPDVQALLSKDAAKIHRPPALPPGTYRSVVHGHKWVISDKKKTPGVEFEFKGFEPQADVSSDAWQAYLADPGCNIKTRTMSTTFWLTDGALYRLTDFFEHCGLKKEGPVGPLIEQCKGQVVLLSIEQTPSKDGKGAWNNITETAQA